MNTVTVVTITRRRPAALLRAIESVRAQRTSAAVEHLIVVDSCEETAAVLDEHTGPNLRWVQFERSPEEHTGPGRVGRLRNISATLSDAPWIAFLDDDNTWREDHLDTLLACAERTGCAVVHSHRELRESDGSPYLRDYFPWAPDPETARAIFRRAVAAGLMAPGSPVIRSTTSPDIPAEFRFVDMGEWLISRSLLLQVPLVEQFTPEEEKVIGEDDFWLAELLERAEPLACTEQPTLRYYLGGMSNVDNPW